jgi:hypothetical protein
MTELMTDRNQHREAVVVLPDQQEASSAGQRPSIRWWTVALGVAAIVLARLGASLVARWTGFLEYNADGYARTVHAAEWAAAPRLEIGVWLPLQFWLTGAALWLWPDVSVTPLVINGLASLASALLLAGIAGRLHGLAAGVVTGLLAAIFPWSVWFGLSGLAEALFSLAVAAAGLGLTLWLTAPQPDASTRDPRGLWLAGLALLAATMLRYEGWFYAVSLALVVLVWATSAERRRPRTLTPLALPFLFPAAWIIGSAAQYGDPFAFARLTSDITAAEGTHQDLSQLDRLLFYPVFAAILAWPVVALAAAGAVWHRRWLGVAPYVLWVLGELAILSLVTARFSGIGAGRDRYVLSTIVLLLPLVGLLLVTLWRQATWGRVGAAAATGLLLWFAGTTLLSRQHPYPAPETVAVADRLRAAWANGTLDADARVPIEVGVPGEQNALFNESYALRVLTSRPAAFDVYWEPAVFNRAVADRAPTVWITDARLANSERPAGLQQASYGSYTVHWRPPPPVVRLDGPARAGARLPVSATGLQPREWAGLWATSADGRTIDLGQARADASGQVRADLTLPAQLVPGRYTLSLRAATTGATGTTRLDVE